MIGGSLSNKYAEDAKKLFEDMASNEFHWSTWAKPPKAARIYEVSGNTILAAKVDTLIKRFYQFMIGSSSNLGQSYPVTHMRLAMQLYNAQFFFALVAPMEIVDYVSGGQRITSNPYSTTYNPV